MMERQASTSVSPSLSEDERLLTLYFADDQVVIVEDEDDISHA